MDIEPLIPVKRPILAEPIEFVSVIGEVNRKILIESQLLNIINYLKTLGYNPRHDYVSSEKQKFLGEMEKATRQYEQARATAIANINMAGTKRIERKMKTIYDKRTVGLKKEIVEEEKNKDGKVIRRFKTTPYEIGSDVFSNIYADFSANPITQPKEFDKEAFERLNGRIFSKWIDGTKFVKAEGQDKYLEVPDLRIFEIKFEWKL